MKIVNSTPTFKKAYRILHASRSAIILPLIDRIENAATLDDLGNCASCDLGLDVCFVYNGVGKLYFQHHNHKTEATLLKFTFSNHFEHSEST